MVLRRKPSPAMHYPEEKLVMNNWIRTYLGLSAKVLTKSCTTVFQHPPFPV
jgi:hypothetical protein